MSKYRKDEKLLKELKTGDHHVWKQFFEEHSNAFLLFVMKYGGMDKDMAIQKYQDAIVILHRKVMRGQLNTPLQSALRTYLFGIGKKICLQKGGTGTFTDDIPDVPIPPSVEEDAEKKHKKELVRKLLDQLDERCRRLLTLIFLKGYATDAVATTMGMPSEGAVRKGQFDCLKKMRRLV